MGERTALQPPPCLALFCHFQREGGGFCRNGFEFQANLREGVRDGRARCVCGGGKRVFPRVTEREDAEEVF